LSSLTVVAVSSDLSSFLVSKSIYSSQNTNFESSESNQGFLSSGIESPSSENMIPSTTTESFLFSTSTDLTTGPRSSIVSTENPTISKSAGDTSSD